MTDWKIVKLGDVCLMNAESYSKNDNWTFVNYLDTGNITANKIESIQHINILKENLPSRARRKVKIDSIIYSTVRPNQRHYGIIKSQPKNFLVSTGFVVINVNPEIVDANFLYYQMTRDEVVKHLQSIAEQSTTAYPSIRPIDIGNLSINLPPLDTQKKIAAVLSALDDKIELNNAINKNLEEQAQGIFKNYFFQSNDNNFSVSSLDKIADYVNGLAMQKFRPTENEIGLPVLKIKELRQGFCDENSDRCTEKIKSDFVVDNGDIIFSWSGTLLVDFWCGGLCGLNQHLFKVIPQKYGNWFCYLWTKYHLKNFQKAAADMATTMGHIRREKLTQSKVFIPNSTDYLRLENLIKPIFDKMINNRLENKKLGEIRDALLPRLLNGKIDVSKVEI